MSIVASLEHMRAAAAAWDSARDHLRTASGMAEGLKLSRVQAGIFQIAWDKYVVTTTYIVDRLNEGAAEAESIGVVLRASADTYEREDKARADVLNRIGTARAN
jgi:hypothetical protein